MTEIVEFEVLRREMSHIGGERGASLRPSDTWFQARDGVPAIITGREIRGFPENGIVRVVKARRRDANDG